MKDNNRSSLAQRIVQDLNEPEKILTAVLTQRRNRPELETVFVPPHDALQADIATLCAELLILDRVGINDDLLELGIDSLGIAQLSTSISSRFKVEVPFEKIFAGPTVAQLALAVGSAKHARAE